MGLNREKDVGLGEKLLGERGRVALAEGARVPSHQRLGNLPPHPSQYRDTSLRRNTPLVVAYSSSMPRDLW